ncbi:MlaD family protein [Novosphingobium piscinae]|uniref:MCE family protein n=1 Tax=Novosphingobium piscinae TaxID=1507448 RepID=A0A7X1G0R5_9SPHN|nr:MlaD family protein [Novosphingobium piscinae]MBC2670441.1 MCE family protein [Novosphingobium piscinae]
METRANHVWVGVVTLALLTLVAAFVVWIARLNEGNQDAYDIFFKQSVDGLAMGSQVTFAGVPAGQIERIELWPRDPSFVRVRIRVDEKVPILQGTTATILGSFTGVSTIQLEGAVKGAPPITELGPEGAPVIPTKRGGLGALLNNAPLLLERLATLSERLTLLLSDKNQQSIENILSNTDRMSANLADASPQIERTLAELQVTLGQASTTLAAFEQTAIHANGLLANEGQPLARQLRETLTAAKQAADALKMTVNEARPAARELSTSTLPAAEAAIRDLRETSRALRDITQKIDDQGAGALLGKSKLPDYQP